jgi:hypothetical protein
LPAKHARFAQESPTGTRPGGAFSIPRTLKGDKHEVEDTDFETARKRFRRDGCAVFGSSHNRPPDRDTAEKSALLFDLLGDDIDGIASLMEDLR